MLVQVMGILVFSYVREKILNIKSPVSLHEEAHKSIDEMENFIFQIDRSHKSCKLTAIYYDKALDFMKQTISYSTNAFFKDNQFYKHLPSRLQQRLCSVVLDKYHAKLGRYFYDSIFKEKASINLVNGILTSLDCQIYVTGSYIYEKGKPVHEMTFIFQGNALLQETTVFSETNQ